MEMAPPERVLSCRCCSAPSRRCGWTDYEVIGPFAELVIEAESPILLHGPVADVQENADHILATLRDAGVAYTAESYDAGGGLLRKYRWAAD